MQLTRARTGPAVAFPAFTSTRRFQLEGRQLRIGRHSAERGLEPEIDMAVPPADPGISRLHAVLIPGPDDNWSLLDPGSANGTLLNGREIAVGELVPLRDGDRINLGVWTVITVHHG
ncbi:MAG: FHA domain-containing protein [Streptosporangiaceae bacterium]